MLLRAPADATPADQRRHAIPGRIGRIVLRNALTYPDVEVVAVNECVQPALIDPARRVVLTD